MNKNALQHVTLITTGGTIDKSYDEFDGTLSNRESLIKSEILSKLRLPYLEVEQISLLNKDSLLFTDQDRKKLCSQVQEQSELGFPIVILHGTDTMTKSAEYIQANVNSLQVPIIFTGAMKPLGFIDSDAPQNVICALMASQLVQPGVYVCFHQKLFHVPGVRKNPFKKTFEYI